MKRSQSKAKFRVKRTQSKAKVRMKRSQSNAKVRVKRTQSKAKARKKSLLHAKGPVKVRAKGQRSRSGKKKNNNQVTLVA